MNKIVFPALLVATVMVAGMFAFAPVEQASTVHLSGTVAANSLVLEGATADDFETTIAVVDPTADRTITLADASGTVLASSTDIVTAAGALSLDTLSTLVDPTAGAMTVTLANGALGQTKNICQIATTTITTITGTITGAATSITMNAVGECVNLLWAGGAWQAVSVNGATFTN